jgi:ribosomal protein S18 acetylase RimI-like enzyme
MSFAINHSEVSATRADEAEQIVSAAREAGVFNAEEIAAVEELIGDYAARGDASTYRFLSYRQDECVVGFACYGPRSLTQGTFDLYWICSAPSAQHKGVGSALLRQTEQEIRAEGGRLVIVETSSLPEYEPARRFYESHGYRREAVIADFYAEGDGLVLYSKKLSFSESSRVPRGKLDGTRS